MGLLTSAANEMIANSVPIRSPISRISEICAMMTGSSETKAPDPKPYRAAMVINGAFDREQ